MINESQNVEGVFTFPSSRMGEFSVGTAYTGTNPKKLTLKFSSVFYGNENQPIVVICSGEWNALVFMAVDLISLFLMEKEIQF